MNVSVIIDLLSHNLTTILSLKKGKWRGNISLDKYIGFYWFFITEVIWTAPPALTDMKLSNVPYPINWRSSALTIFTINWYDFPLICGLDTIAIYCFLSNLFYNYSGSNWSSGTPPNSSGSSSTLFSFISCTGGRSNGEIT